MSKKTTPAQEQGYFGDIDRAADELKYRLGNVAMLGLLFVTALVTMSGFRTEPTQSLFDLNRIPVTLLIVGPVVAASIWVANHFARKSIDRMVTNKKAEYTNKLEGIASTNDGVIVDYSGPEPRLAREAVA